MASFYDARWSFYPLRQRNTISFLTKTAPSRIWLGNELYQGPVVIPRIEMNRNKAEKSRNNPTIKNILFSSPLQMPTAPVNEKVGHKRHQRKNIKSTSINHILPFVIRNLSPAARNSDGRETPDDSQRETNGRGRKSEYPAELTFQFVGLSCCCCTVLIISEVDGVSRYCAFGVN